MTGKDASRDISSRSTFQKHVIKSDEH